MYTHIHAYITKLLFLGFAALEFAHYTQMSMSAALAHIIALVLTIAPTLLAVFFATAQLDTQNRAMATLAQVRNFSVLTFVVLGI